MTLQLSGQRFDVTYRLHGPPEEAEARAAAICLEQTVEFPAALLPSAAIREQIVGELARLTPLGPDLTEIVIRYPVETAGAELTQWINVLFGNVALQPGVRLMDIRLPKSMTAQLRGPRFGIAGLRALLGVTGRPLLCTAVKPMGLTPEELAGLAYQFARGGIDLIKDDHGLSDQPFCRFEERVARCTAAVARANHDTGGHSLYLPNVTAPAPQIMERARYAQAAGAGGLLFCPGLGGFDTMRALADDDALALPILSHPALLGGLCVDPRHGIAHRVLYGLLNRLAGADGAIFPNFGGRFAFTPAQCRDLVAGTQDPLGALAPIWPVPAGGMGLARVAELRAFYGDDCMLLIGGDLHASDDLIARCQAFRALAEAPLAR